LYEISGISEMRELSLISSLKDLSTYQKVEISVKSTIEYFLSNLLKNGVRVLLCCGKFD